MILDNDKIEVINRTGGTVAYTIDELHLKRRFLQNESKQIEMGELRKLSWTPGGKVLLEQCLVIKNDNAIKELLGSVEPEYNYTEAEVKNLLINGSLDELKDAIDFAPAGVIDLKNESSIDAAFGIITQALENLGAIGDNPAEESKEETNSELDDLANFKNSLNEQELLEIEVE